MQNLLICKSIAYIYSGAFTTYIFVLYIYHGGEEEGGGAERGGERQIIAEFLEKNKKYYNYVLFHRISHILFPLS